MIIRNNRRTLITLEYKRGGKRTLAPIAAGKEVIISDLLDFSNVISKIFFDKGWLSVVKEKEKNHSEHVVDIAKKQVEVYTEEIEVCIEEVKENAEEIKDIIEDKSSSSEENQEEKPKRKRKNKKEQN